MYTRLPPSDELLTRNLHSHLCISVFVCFCVCLVLNIFSSMNWVHFVSTNFILSPLQPRERGRLPLHMLQNAQIAINFLKYRDVSVIFD